MSGRSAPVPSTAGAVVRVPTRLAASCRGLPEREEWLARLPSLVRDLADRWQLTLGPPFDSDEVSCAWVAVVTRDDGTSAVLKIGMPHLEGEQEIQGLRFWDGDPTVRLLEADDAANAMLLERCEPGTHLRQLSEPEQDAVIAGLLRRLWRPPPPNHSFRDLYALMASWRDETLADAERWSDPGLVHAGLELLQELSISAASTVVLATDLHAGNALRARRQPWLVIDPKPVVGDAAYDATQHLLNCRSRLGARPAETINRFADLLGVDRERVRLWTFARAAAEPRVDWSNDAMELARIAGRVS
jgi:streptomycin 6-kinase